MTEDERIELAASCSDVSYFPREPGAGAVIIQDGRRVQRTHFGGLVIADGYYGSWMTDLIERLEGVHEPQEERAFAEVLPFFSRTPRMLECGGYWAFYSLWLKKMYPNADINILEPIDERRQVGEANFELNGLAASFLRAAIGDQPGHVELFQNGPCEASSVDIVTIDQLFEEREWSKLDILHADIQGFEYRMLLGAADTLANHKVDWLFISTHRWLEDGVNMDLHVTCKDILTTAGYQVVVEHTPEESYTVDGLIVAKAPGVNGVRSIQLSRLQHS